MTIKAMIEMLMTQDHAFDKEVFVEIQEYPSGDFSLKRILGMHYDPVSEVYVLAHK